MNKERIKEIAKRSGIEYGSAVKHYYSHCTDGVQEEDMIKFAQLIIEECCAIIYENEYSTPNQCAWKIESHFGV